MRVYFDTCCIQRPLDDKGHPRVQREAEAVAELLRIWQDGRFELIGSDPLMFEAKSNPHAARRRFAFDILDRVDRHVTVSPAIVATARELVSLRLKALDALHVSAAIQIGADIFCICDDELLRRGSAAMAKINCGLRVVSPIELVEELKP